MAPFLQYVISCYLDKQMYFGSLKTSKQKNLPPTGRNLRGFSLSLERFLEAVSAHVFINSACILCSISEISMEVAEPGHVLAGSPPAHLIERCDCPPGYSGLSCEVS